MKSGSKQIASSGAGVPYVAVFNRFFRAPGRVPFM